MLGLVVYSLLTSDLLCKLVWKPVPGALVTMSALSSSLSCIPAVHLSHSYIPPGGWPRHQAPSEKMGKGPGSVSVYFLSTFATQSFEEPIRLWNESTWNVISSHAHEAKWADYAIWWSSS